MQLTPSIAAGMIALTSTAVAQIVTCDGNTTPVFEDCQTLGDTLRGYSADFIPNLYPTGCTAMDPANGADPSSLNCQVLYCPSNENVRTTGTRAAGTYDLIRVDCISQGAGGSAPEEDYYIAINANPNYKPASPPSEKRAPEFEREHPKQLAKRQVPAEDTGFTLVSIDNNLERDGIQITGRRPAGSLYVTSVTDVKTASVSTSVGVEASFFDFFGTSTGVETTAEDSIQSLEGDSINIDCPSGQSGQVFWYPLYTRYGGFTTPSNTNVFVTIPLDTDISKGNYRVNCVA